MATLLNDILVKNQQISELKQELTKQKVIFEKQSDEQLGQIVQLESQVISEKEKSHGYQAEVDRLLRDITKLKMLIDEQMGVSVRQREKLISLKQESGNLETDLQMLHQKMQDSESTIRGQSKEIDKLKRLLRKADGSNANKLKIKELE